MKSLSKRASDRYATALDFAVDLNQFLSQGDGLNLVSGALTFDAGSGQLRSRTRSLHQGIVPKGLRSFGPEDAHFFLRLLPGPYDRDGTPESIMFWKRRVESVDPDTSFRVGLLYGPSGCGKSSFVRAGLLPKLDDQITPVFVEAAPGTTESRLLSRLRRRCPYLNTDLGLRETIATLRQPDVMGEGKKVLIVIDQFEQWLHSNEREQSQLVSALRQCRPDRVQCIVMVRDDFWMAATNFMRQLEVRLIEDHNSNAVELFPIRHAGPSSGTGATIFCLIPTFLRLRFATWRPKSGAGASSDKGDRRRAQLNRPDDGARQ